MFDTCMVLISTSYGRKAHKVKTIYYDTNTVIYYFKYNLMLYDHQKEEPLYFLCFY